MVSSLTRLIRGEFPRPIEGICSQSRSRSSAIVQDLLSAIPEQTKDTTVYEAALGAALLASLDALVRIIPSGRNTSLNGASGGQRRAGGSVRKHLAYHRSRCIDTPR